MTYARAQYALVFFLLFYSAVGFGAHFSSSSQGVYPFFSWFLFVEIPSRVQTNFELFVTELSDRTVDFPLHPEELPGVLWGGVEKKNFNILVRRLGEAIKGKQAESVDELRRELELYLPGVVSYEVQEVVFNPIQRFRFGDSFSSESIGRFRKETL